MNGSKEIWLKSLRKRYAQFQEMKNKLPDNSVMRKRGVPFKERMFNEKKKEMLNSWIENLKEQAKRQPPEIQNLNGFTLEDYYFLFYDLC